MGTVENLPDGSVKVIAQGEEEILNRFLEKLKRGPLLSKVEDIKIDWSDNIGIFKDFKIVYHGFLDHF
jgi:acylphosphatase